MMNVLIRIAKTVTVYTLGLFYTVLILLDFLVNYIKNPFESPWSQKLRLQPPQELSDPKYGVHQYAKVNDIKLHYLESGNSSKPLMIFVHGFPEFWYSWRHQIVEFNKNYWVVAVDMRGYGDSEKPEDIGSYRIELLAKDLRELLRHLGRDKCIMVAHDWGSLVACEFYDTYPECLLALVIAAGGSRSAFQSIIIKDSEQRMKSWYTFFFQIPYVPELLLTRYDLQMVEELMKTAGGTNADIECFKYKLGKPGVISGPINYYRANINRDLPRRPTKEENVPFIHGAAEKDPHIKTEILEYMKKQYKHIETTVIKGVGHFVQQEAPEQFNKFVTDFLSKHNL